MKIKILWAYIVRENKRFWNSSRCFRWTALQHCDSGVLPVVRTGPLESMSTGQGDSCLKTGEGRRRKKKRTIVFIFIPIITFTLKCFKRMKFLFYVYLALSKYIFGAIWPVMCCFAVKLTETKWKFEITALLTAPSAYLSGILFPRLSKHYF